MTRVPVVNQRQVVKALERIGYSSRPGKGSHMVCSKNGLDIGVPKGKKTLRRSTVSNILRQAGLSNAEFSRLVKE